MVLMNKEYLELIHGYTLKESAVMVTIPSNVAQFFIGLGTGFLGDFLIKKKVGSHTLLPSPVDGGGTHIQRHGRAGHAVQVHCHVAHR